MDDILQVS